MSFSGNKPISEVILYDANGNLMTVRDGYLLSEHPSSVLVAGSDGTNARLLRMASDGTVRVDPTGTTVQPIIGPQTIVSSVNSSTVTLGSSATFTGSSEEVKNFSTIIVFVHSSHASATNGLSVEFSTDGTNWDRIHTFTISASIGQSYTFGPEARYIRVRYTNGGTSQSSFRLQTLFSYESIKYSTHRVDSTITKDDDTELVRAVLTAKRPDGSYGNVLSDADGNILVITQIVQAGANTGVATGSVILGGSTANTIQAVRATAYNEQSTGAQRSIASSNINDTLLGTGARSITITYFTSSGAGPYTETVSLAGTVPVATVATDICFIEKMAVTSIGSGGRNAGTITLYVNNVGGGGAIGSIGVGNIVATQGDNQTFWAHHYIPVGKTAQLATLVVSAVSGGSGTNATFFLRSVAIPSTNLPELVVSDLLLVTASQVRVLDIPIVLMGPAKVVAYGIPGVNNATLNATFDFSELDT